MNRMWRRGWDSNPRYSCPYTAFPVPHLRPLGHPSYGHTRAADHTSLLNGGEKLAEGRGFEPPRDSRPYPISSRTPSTGLGHPSASVLSMIMLNIRHPPSSWTGRKSTPAATKREANASPELIAIAVDRPTHG